MEKHNAIVNDFARKNRISRFDIQRMVEALIVELDKIKGELK